MSKRFLKLVEFIKNNADWEQKLQDKPYCITIKRTNNFIVFNYSQNDSDFFNPIVKECRGIILEDYTYKPVCVPFYKFGNYGEGYADTIDWSTARVQEKVDGSLIKVWYYNGEWKVSTNGMIDARDAELACNISEYKTFYDLFIKAVENVGLDFNKLNPRYTYMFELISPFNRVVVPYTEISLRHIGTRDIDTLEELNIDIGVPKPKEYNFKSLNECIRVAQELPFNEEGYVVVDGNWHRIKVKSPAYVAVHHLKNNGLITKERIVELIRLNEYEEFLNYYPEYTEQIINIKNKIYLFIENMNSAIDKAQNTIFSTRKDFAEFAKKTMCPALMFSWYDKKVSTVKEWLWHRTNEKIVMLIGE